MNYTVNTYANTTKSKDVVVAEPLQSIDFSSAIGKAQSIGSLRLSKREAASCAVGTALTRLVIKKLWTR